MALKDVLKDKAKFPDDLKMNLNGVELTLGEWRVEADAFEAKQADLARQQGELQQAQLQTANAWAKVLEGQETLKGMQERQVVSQPNAQPFDYKRDPLLGPLVEKYDAALAKAIEKAEAAEVKATQQAAEFAKVSGHYLNKEWQRDFSAIADKPKDLELKQVLDFAVKNRVIDEMGIPDVQRATHQMTEQFRIDSASKRAADEAYARGQNDALMGSLPKPGASYGSAAGADGTQTFKTLDEAIAAAARDPELGPQLLGR